MPLSCFHCVPLTSENSSISERGNVDEESILHHKNEKSKECEIQYEKVEQVCLIFSEQISCYQISYNIYIDQLELQWRQAPPCSSWDTGRVAPLIFPLFRC